MSLAARGPVLAAVTTAVLAAGVLAGCSTRTDGNASSASSLPSASIGTTASASGSSALPTASSSISSATPNPTPTPTSAATTTSPPAGSLRRTPAATAIGDPVTANFCAGGAAFLAPLRASAGLTAQLSDGQYLGGCSYAMIGNGETQFRVYESSLRPGTSTDKRLAPLTRTHLSGHLVYRRALDTTVGDCERFVPTTGVVLEVSTFASAITTTSPALCRAADLATAHLITVLGKGKLPRLRLPAATVTGLDLCAVARAARVTSAPVLGAGVSVETRSYGAECGVRGARVNALFDAITVTARGLVNYALRPLAGHRIRVATFSTASTCYLASVQHRLPGTGRYEAIQLYVSAVRANDPPAGLCRSAAGLLVDFLDAARLR